MGLGSTVKNVFSTDEPTTVGPRGTTSAPPSTHETRDSKFVGDRTSHQLPPGSGPGTSGKPPGASELAMQTDLERSRVGTFGYGSDAAAAVGGSLAGTHQGSMAAMGGGTRQSFDSKQSGGTRRDSTYSTGQNLGTGVGSGGVLEEGHEVGHTKSSERDAMPSGVTQENTHQLHPVVHERVRHVEVEEFSHVKTRERHVHHIQHHTQPVTFTEELPERLRDNTRPVTRVNEIHANKPEDSILFEHQIYKNRDSVVHAAKERTTVDKPTVENVSVHHHVHHVIQPVIEKETIERERIRTTIPTHEVTQEAPVVHQSQFHNSVDMRDFLKRGGFLEGGIPQEDITGKVLHSGKCVREIDNTTATLGDMNLGNKNAQGRTTDDLPSRN